MHKMAMVMNDKMIHMTKCCFCRSSIVSDEISCERKLMPSEECPSFTAVDDVSKKVEEIFAKLPDGYGEQEIKQERKQDNN